MAITVQLVGKDRVVQHLQAMSEQARRSIQRAVVAEAIRVQARVRQKLAGEVLQERSHHLHDSIHFEAPVEEASGIYGKVGTNVVYAAFHEYGFKGTEQVREHTRRISVAFGKPIATVEATIRAHARRVDYPARSFLRSSLAELEPEIRARLDQAVNEAVKT